MSVLLALALTSAVIVLAQDDQSGFISLDCGIAKGLTYTDTVTGINYISDADFIDSGESHNILSIENLANVDTQLTSLTSFPQNIRNCYTLRPTQGKGAKYLIRARFMYGNYDYKSQVPAFDVYIGPDYWDTVKFNLPSEPISMEIIHILASDYIHVCLVNTGRGTPFISAIELRLLTGNLYEKANMGSLYLFRRFNFGSGSRTIRYKDDKYDRLWSAISTGATVVSTSDKVEVGASAVNDPPVEVMSTAVTTDPMDMGWIPENPSDKFRMYIHFAEIEILKSNQTREFNIYLNGVSWYGPLIPPNHTTITIFSTLPETVAPRYTVTINKTERSTLPPIINAIEVYAIKQLPQKQTDDQDAAAMWRIKSAYGIEKHWQGDPCAPHEFVWDGLKCSYDDTDSCRIISLNLSTSGLNGEIDPGLANLTMIQTLDLSNNNFTGTVPNFLSGLKFLKVLNLKGNNFNGSVPEELLAKSKEGSLLMSFDGESTGDSGSTCGTNGCEKKKDNQIILLVLAAVAFIIVIVAALIAIWIFRKPKSHDKKEPRTGLEIKKQKYTYSEVKKITKNFSVTLGQGGSGKVYHGYIGDDQVAVKMLSDSSPQGNKQFKTEANLLLSVHHKNLTSLVGFCDERNHKGIIYEYMAHGDLERHLLDMDSSVLNWEERLQIGCDAAQGLQYLHHSCKPPIVHRDVKCTNILLNGTYDAKLADFGLSRAYPIEGGSHISTVVAGTLGYLDPEYYTSKRLTEKSDVYSFGIVLLVIITGQPALKKHENENINISQWVTKKLTEGDIKNIVDPRLSEDFDISSARKVVELAMACAAHMPRSRPMMNDVVMELSNCLEMDKARREMKSRPSTRLGSLNLEGTHDSISR